MRNDLATIDDDVAARLALLALSDVGPARLSWLLSEGSPVEATQALLKGRWPVVNTRPPVGVGPKQLRQWSQDLLAFQGRLKGEAQRYRHLQVAFLTPDDGLWPFAQDPAPPLLLFARGSLDLLASVQRLGVAVVGTRRCTSVGRSVAYQLAYELAESGVGVVSGLALGIDGAAHRGTLDAGGSAIGVVGTGLDVIYPKANRGLWDEVIADGVLVSEFPLGTQPAKWRFPARNRLIAGLAIGVVVVESHRSGGALSTVHEAAERGLAVMAVPGSVLSPASDGTNSLLFDGAVPVRDGADVLGHLNLVAPNRSGSGIESAGDLSGSVSDAEASFEDLVNAEIAVGPVHVDQLVASSGLPVASVVARLEAMRAEGRLTLDGSSVFLRPDRC